MSVFTLAVAPTLNYENLDERMTPLRVYLAEHLGQDVAIVQLDSYAETLNALATGSVDAASLGDLASTAGASSGYVEPLLQQVGVSDKQSTYRSVFATLTDSDIYELSDLRGKTLGVADSQSTSGYVMPRSMLREVGINPDTDVVIRQFGGHRAVAAAIMAGEVDAGAMHENTLIAPSPEEEAAYATMRVVARSREIPRGPIVVRANLDAPTRTRLSSALVQMHETVPDVARTLLTNGLRFTLVSGRKNPTLKSIASLAGVSIATVSRVVNDSGYVSARNRELIESIVRDIGYAPNGNARVLMGREAPMVGFVASLADASSLDELNSIAPAFEQAGIPLVICPAIDGHGAAAAVRTLRDKRLGALIVSSGLIHDQTLTELGSSTRLVLGIGDSDVPEGIIATSYGTLLNDVRAVLGT